jgi:hypothetical protein
MSNDGSRQDIDAGVNEASSRRWSRWVASERVSVVILRFTAIALEMAWFYANPRFSRHWDNARAAKVAMHGVDRRHGRSPPFPPTWRLGMAQHLPHGHDYDDANDTQDSSVWWQALMASHTFRSVLAMAVVMAGVALFAASVHR